MKKTPDILDYKAADLLVETIHNYKHKTCLLLMLDAGLRVSEAIALRYQNFNFREKTITINSNKEQHNPRTIPLSERLYATLANYIQTQHPKSTQDYLFPGKTKGTHLTRKAINRVCDRLKNKYPSNFNQLHPYTLRHTFATLHLAHGTQLSDVKNMLGHQSLVTTATYAHTPLETIRKSINQVTRKPLSLFGEIKNWLSTTRKKTINLNTANIQLTIGRQEEINHIHELISRNCNVILLGPIGVGKSHIIQQIKLPERKILEVDDCTDIKNTLIQCLLYLYKNDKAAVFKLIHGNYQLDNLHQHLQRGSMANLIQEIIQITAPKEYLLIIDNLDNITARAAKALEALKDHFTILTSAREIPINKSSFLWNFELIHIKELTRHNSIQLIQNLSNGLEIEDFEIYRNHIYEQTNGNPRAITELIDRYRQEPYLTTEIIREIKHTGTRKEYDMSIFVILLFGGLSVLRYVSHEAGSDRLRLIGGCALLLLITARYFFRTNKKKRTIN